MEGAGVELIHPDIFQFVAFLAVDRISVTLDGRIKWSPKRNEFERFESAKTKHDASDA
jgi:hypothetical protein